MLGQTNKQKPLLLSFFAHERRFAILTNLLLRAPLAQEPQLIRYWNQLSVGINEPINLCRNAALGTNDGREKINKIDQKEPEKRLECIFARLFEIDTIDHFGCHPASKRST